MATSMGLGLLLLVAIYAGLWVIREHTFAAIFFQNSSLIFWVPPAEVFLASWAVVILLLKYQKHQQQDSVFANESLLQWPERITVKDASSLITQIENTSAQPRRSFLLHRIVRLLAYFRDSGNRLEVASLLASQSDIDVTVVHSSYTMLRVFIWAIPILGFIGTVLGIGEAIGGFAGLSDIDRLQEQLAPITGGLAGAFQTTLIALILSLCIMFPTSALQRAELRLLNRVDDFCNEQLLRCLSTRGTGHHPEDLKDLSREMGAQFAGSLEATIQKITVSQAALAANVHSAVETQHNEIIQLRNAMTTAAEASQEVVSQLDSLVERFTDRITAVYGEALAHETAHIQQMVATAYEPPITRIEALHETLRSEAETLAGVNQHAKAIAEATETVAQLLKDLPLHIISPLEERLHQVLVPFGVEVATVVEALREATSSSSRSIEELEGLSQQLREQWQAISSEVSAWVDAARDTTVTVRSSLSATSHEIAESANAFHSALETAGNALLGSVGASQASLAECIAALQAATQAISQLVKHVDARRELDTLHAAVERVSQLFNTNSHMASTEHP